MAPFHQILPRADYKTCKRCHRHASEVGELSRRRLCDECGDLLRKQAASDLYNHKGPYFDNWRRGVAASVGAALLDDTQAKP